MSPYEGIILAMNSVMGFPVNQMLVSQAAASAPEHLRGALTGRLTPLLGLGTMLVSNISFSLTPFLPSRGLLQQEPMQNISA